MRMVSKGIMAIVVFWLATMVASANNHESLKGAPPGDGPLEVLMGFNLVNITDVGEKNENVEFDGAIYLEWMDPRLAYDPATYGMPANWTPGDYSMTPTHIYQGDYAVKETYMGWRPHVVIPNGIGNRIISNMAISIWPDGRVAYSETFFAKAETPMDLRRFPFDAQSLEIFFHPFLYKRDEVILVPDDRLARTWNQNMGIADWSRENVTMREQAIDIAYFDESRSQVSEFVVNLQIKRRPTHLLVSIILPMIILVALTWCVFWMDNESVSSRVNITFIGILSVVAYYFVILDNIPEVSYLTLIDAFIISTFMILSAGVVLSVVMETLGHKNKVHLARRVDRICRWAFPLGYFITASVLGVIFFNLY